jgi:hypothetical protein
MPVTNVCLESPAALASLMVNVSEEIVAGAPRELADVRPLGPDDS